MTMPRFRMDTIYKSSALISYGWRGGKGGRMGETKKPQGRVAPGVVNVKS